MLPLRSHEHDVESRMDVSKVQLQLCSYVCLFGRSLTEATRGGDSFAVGDVALQNWGAGQDSLIYLFEPLEVARKQVKVIYIFITVYQFHRQEIGPAE